MYHVWYLLALWCSKFLSCCYSYVIECRSVSKVHDEWFADEENVRKAVGLLEKPVEMPYTREVTTLALQHRYLGWMIVCYHLFICFVSNVFAYLSQFLIKMFHFCDSWLVEFVLKAIHGMKCLQQPVVILFVVPAGEVRSLKYYVLDIHLIAQLMWNIFFLVLFNSWLGNWIFSFKPPRYWIHKNISI